MSGDQSLEVSCRPAADGWACRVRVGADRGATEHRVTVDRATLERLRPGSGQPDELVRAAFGFLLAREPREAILRSFSLTEIGRYFPGWESEISG